MYTTKYIPRNFYAEGSPPMVHVYLNGDFQFTIYDYATALSLRNALHNVIVPRNRGDIELS